jgi:hypothetical protein
MGRASRDKGKRHERDVARWFDGTLRWPAHRTAMQAHRRGDTPDVHVESPIGVLFVECKNDRKLPGKAFLDAWEQAESYCIAGQVPVLMLHLHGSNKDMVVMEKEALRRLIGAFDGVARVGKEMVSCLD